MVRIVRSQMGPVDSIQVGGAAQGKRKTPSELREEQLKRKKFIEVVDESTAPLRDSNNGMVGFKKPNVPKNPKYIETRLGDVYQVKKPRPQLFSGKENAQKQENHSVERYRSLKVLPILSNVATNEQPAVCIKESIASSEAAEDNSVKSSAAVDKGNEHTFRSVAELSLGKNRLSGQTVVDMDEALKGIVANKPPAFLSVPSNSSKWGDNLLPTNSINLCPELTVPRQMTPLDLTLKMFMRVVSSSSLSWLHRSITGRTYHGMSQCFMQQRDSVNQKVHPMAEPSSDCQKSKSKALHSWVYPQSSLPSSVIKTLTLSADEGAGEFLRNRHSAWEDAFRCLYFLLRKNVCSIFYVCAAQFVVMFTSSPMQGKAKYSCKSYISRSTRGLRALLKENDVCFSMPLSPSRIDDATMDDFVELLEIEKQNLGQTRRRSSSDIDGTPKSLLAFDRNQSVHGLYDVLLNNRSLLFTSTVADVPLLYSPVIFQNASLHAPEFQFKELKKLDHTASLKGSTMKTGQGQEILSSAASYSIEVRDKYIPPWIICNLCAIMCSAGEDFEASFTPEPTSAGLNFALESLDEKSKEKAEESKEKAEDIVDTISTLGISDAFVAAEMSSAVLKGLKYCNSTISASLSRI